MLRCFLERSTARAVPILGRSAIRGKTRKAAVEEPCTDRVPCFFYFSRETISSCRAAFLIRCHETRNTVVTLRSHASDLGAFRAHARGEVRGDSCRSHFCFHQYADMCEACGHTYTDGFCRLICTQNFIIIRHTVLSHPSPRSGE